MEIVEGRESSSGGIRECDLVPNNLTVQDHYIRRGYIGWFFSFTVAGSYLFPAGVTNLLGVKIRCFAISPMRQYRCCHA